MTKGDAGEKTSSGGTFNRSNPALRYQQSEKELSGEQTTAVVFRCKK
jgi:hypothetical protein